MNKTKKWWMPVLLACVLMAILVGMAGATPNARPYDAPVGWKKLTVPVQNCVPQEETMNYRHQSDYLQCQSSSCLFFCPVNIPTESSVTVQRLTLYAYDDDATMGHFASAHLYKINPADKDSVSLASAATENSTTDPQVVKDGSIDNARIRRAEGPYLTVFIWGTSVKVYGVRIHYTR